MSELPVGGEPSLLFDQMELPLPGINALTDVERAMRVVGEDDSPSLASTIAQLVIDDAHSRRHRARRWLEVWGVQSRFDSPSGWLTSGGFEVLWLYDEAVHCFVQGLYAATTVAGHAACERATAGALAWQGFSERGWEYWGLPRLAKSAMELGIITDRLYGHLVRLSEVRKVLAHFKSPFDPDSVHVRALGDSRAAQLEDDELLELTLMEDARFALRLATAMVRGQPGFYQVDLV